MGVVSGGEIGKWKMLMRKPRSVLEQLDLENRREAYEERRLQQMAWTATANVRHATPEQLRAAAALADHTGALGFVGRCAAAELKRRGLS
jgi:hypothetical protein